MKCSQNVVRIGVFYYCEYSTIGCGILGVENVEKTPCKSRTPSYLGRTHDVFLFRVIQFTSFQWHEQDNP